MSNEFTADENVVFSLTTKQNQALADLPGGASSLSVGSLFVIREGSTINLADTGVTFSELSADDDGQYLATLDRTALTTKDGSPFVQQAGDGFVFSYRAEILPGQFVGTSDNLFASIRSGLDLDEIQTRFDSQDFKLQEICDSLDGGTVIGLGEQLDCCTKLIKIIQGSAYTPGFQWDLGEDVTGQEVSMRLQGQDFAGSADGSIASVPFTVEQTESLEITTHERSEYRLRVGNQVIVGRAEIV